MTHHSSDARLQAWVRSEGATHPMLVTGVSESGLQAAASELIEWAIRENLTSRAEVLWHVPRRQHISIAEVRMVISALLRTTFGLRRLIILPRVHALTLPAATALLKSLEEAPPSNRILLLTPWPQRLLTTLRSRCQHLYLSGTQSAVPVRSTILADSVARRFFAAASYSEESLADLGAMLSLQLRLQGPDAQLRLATTRLRDYYRIKSARGNEKLAREVLLASLPG